MNRPFDREYMEYQLGKGGLRKAVRRMVYLEHARKYVTGKAIDFGCGVGELLAILPEGSVGLEVNRAAVEYCRGRGLPVDHYDPEADGYRFEAFGGAGYRTFIMSHVLEHLEDPAAVLGRVLDSCRRLGIERVIVIVPGRKGFAFDKTHRVYVDRQYLRDKGLPGNRGFVLSRAEDHPFCSSWMGRYFTHQEVIFVYDRS